VVADAVAFEPVSNAKFPANREKNRESRRIRTLDAILTAGTRAISKACSEIPYATEQGDFFELSGKFFEIQGIGRSLFGNTVSVHF
jgi:hypothetical protein